MYGSHQGEDHHGPCNGPLVSYAVDQVLFSLFLSFAKWIDKAVNITSHYFELHSWNRISLPATPMQKEGKIIDPLMLSQRVHWWAKIKKPLNSAIANNEPSLLKLQQALIGFKVMKKTTWSIIIKARCRHVKAWDSCCEWRGRAPSIKARTGPCPWGNHPSTSINISEAAAPEAFHPDF